MGSWQHPFMERWYWVPAQVQAVGLTDQGSNLSSVAYWLCDLVQRLDLSEFLLL